MDFGLHPVVASFPLAFVGLLLLLEVVRTWPKVGRLTQVRGIVCGAFVGAIIVTFFSGYPANEAANQQFIVPDDPLATHHAIGRLALLAAVPLGLFFYLSEYGKYSRTLFLWCYRVTLLFAMVLVMYTGSLGGELIFRFGAGVRVVEK